MTIQIDPMVTRPATPTSATATTPTPAASAAPAQPASSAATDAPGMSLFMVHMDDQSTEKLEKAWQMPVGVERRKFVYDTLLETTRATQEPVWKAIEGLQQTGQVKDFKPFWIQNSIAVVGTKEAASQLGALAGISSVQDVGTTLGPVPPTVNEESAPLAGEGAVAETGQRGSDDGPIEDWGLSRINAGADQSEGLSGKGVTVGVLDTGVDFSHPALITRHRGYDHETGRLNLTGGWADFAGDSKDKAVDENGHGTHVAGKIAGSDGNRNVIGVAPGAKLIGARGLGPKGGTDRMLLDGLQYLAMPLVPGGDRGASVRDAQLGADIINNSWGSDAGMDTSYSIAMRNLAAMGITVVNAAGNDGRTGSVGSVGSPGSSPWAISVAASDKDDKPAAFSSRGPAPLQAAPGQDPTPFIAAPGVDIRSSVPGGRYERGWDGTSMAAPHVAGAAARILEAAKDATGRFFDVRGVKEVIKRTARDVGPEGLDTGTGYGILNLNGIRDAVRAVAEELGMDLKPKQLNIFDAMTEQTTADVA